MEGEESGATRPDGGGSEGGQNAETVTNYTQQDLELELVSSIECLRQLGIILENYKQENESYFFEKMNKLVDHYQRVHDRRGAVEESVPIALIQDYLDKGLNPELYTKKRLEVAEALHQQNKGRVDSLKLLRDNVQSEIQRRLGPPAEITFFEPKQNGENGAVAAGGDGAGAAAAEEAAP